jgi:hypothetical protein
MENESILFMLGCFFVFYILIKILKKIFSLFPKSSKIYNYKDKDFGFHGEEGFEDFKSTEIQERLKDIKKDQKDLMKNGKAIVCDTKWTLSGSVKKGTKMTNNIIKLTAISYNNQCDSYMKSITHKNYESTRKKIIKSANDINKLNEIHNVKITKEYVLLKKIELQLIHNYQKKKQEEADIQREIKAQMREEQKAQKELEKAIKEEEKFQKELNKELLIYKKATKEEKQKLKLKIEKLKEEIEKSKRAKSMAQQTKSGHVYIISNEGSFGKNVFKIGMTRRLEPNDRIKELGDASVPFEFDVHAMIFSKNAPKLEKKLHNDFSDYRVNKVNKRKEFFNIPIDELQKDLTNMDLNIKFLKEVEAMEYNLSKEINKKGN